MVSRLQKFAKLVNANARVTKDRTQRADGDDAAFVDGNGHALAIGFAPQMKMTTALALFGKAARLRAQIKSWPSTRGSLSLMLALARRGA